MVIDTDLTPHESEPPLPKVGLTMRVPPAFENLTWFGRGPHESYPDRWRSADVGWMGDEASLGAYHHYQGDEYEDPAEPASVALLGLGISVMLKRNRGQP